MSARKRERQLKAIGTALAKERCGVRPPVITRAIVGAAVGAAAVAFALAMAMAMAHQESADIVVRNLWIAPFIAMGAVGVGGIAGGFARQDLTWVDVIVAKLRRYQPVDQEAFDAMQRRVLKGRESGLDVVEEWLVAEWQRL